MAVLKNNFANPIEMPTRVPWNKLNFDEHIGIATYETKYLSQSQIQFTGWLPMEMHLLKSSIISEKVATLF